MYETPILFIIFNRPEYTKQVFEEIRKQKPKRLFIAADGPRHDRPEDLALCKSTREIINSIDWDCEIETLFSEINLGCGLAPATAITWFFGYVEAGIILEDDCLPSKSFFSFCEELLLKFKDDKEVMHITGANLNDDLKYGDGSYFYSNYANIWGWATWRRAWNYFKYDLDESEDYKRLVKETFNYKSERQFWYSRIDLLKNYTLDAWDYQWMLAIWKAKGLCLNSNYNLVENIGFGSNATHTTGCSPFKNKNRSTLTEVNHPKKKQIIVEAEENFIYLLHGIKRVNTIRFFVKERSIQRFLNLIHKLKLTFFK